MRRCERDFGENFRVQGGPRLDGIPACRAVRFAESDAAVSLTDEQQRLLQCWAKLDEEQRAALFEFLKKL